MEPPPCARIAGAAYLIPRSAARTCRCITRVEAFRRHRVGAIARTARAGIVEEDVQAAEMLRGGSNRGFESVSLLTSQRT